MVANLLQQYNITNLYFDLIQLFIQPRLSLQCALIIFMELKHRLAV